MIDPLHKCTTNTNPDSNVNVYISRYCKPWKISDDGLSFIAVWESGALDGTYAGHKVIEGFILTAYLDNAGIPTVGCGHRIYPSDHIKVGDTISLERARGFKAKAIEKVESRLNSDVNVPLYQFEYDALASIIYNCGENSGAGAIIDKINTGHYETMFDYILTYRVGRNKGLPPRRFSEARLFESGIYDASY
ncbi:lysozyme [Paraburkholderia ferrariae]|uniref:lysozyme n=1 Tax=Paraburkholderia ferrariae TaxID=386056 RepID=UPI0012EC3AE3|nr:lysozyme [Paraburkholderia ferrariae]